MNLSCNYQQLSTKLQSGHACFQNMNFPPILADKAARSAFQYYSQYMPDKTIKCL